ncbi:MAG: UDP-N-acetylmuramate dehydrogenase [Clostridia bacterium]|nr:UDP-N-acetylmuramate dehydrogenase [Clostridia bacterium]
MDLKELIGKSNLQIDKYKILYNEPMSKHTSFKIGGPAECFIIIDNIDDLKEILSFVKKNKIPLTVVGNGSNLLVLDNGIKGITVCIKLEGIDLKEENESYVLKVASGEKIGKVARMMCSKEISALEELLGIPGTIGGAIKMNAGAHGKEMKDIVTKVTCMDYDGNIKEFSNEEMKFEYRKSMLKEEKYIVLEVELKLQKGNKEEIQDKIEKYSKYRKEKQPMEYPSAGSTFKRGEDFITAKLIDDAGLKGYSIGGAEVSTKHSGFIINKENATAKDVLNLVEYVKDEVFKKFGKVIELEIEVVGK